MNHSDNSCDSIMDSNADQGPQVFADFPAAQHKAKPQQASHQFSGLGLQDLLVVEICAGSARLTKTVRAKGMRGLAIDKTKSRGCGTEIMVLDLTLEQDLRILLQLLRSESKCIALVFISPPCGTASKARERPIKASLLFGQKQPEPLRTSSKPDQKDMLSGLDKVKTELANQLYEAVTAIVLECDKLGLWVMVENPRSSLYWDTSFARRYIQAIETFWIDFHNCAHGGQRDKLTRLWSNRSWGKTLELFCDKRHSHASWKPKIVNGRLSFPTAEEAAYPWLFCERVVHLVEQLAVENGCDVHHNLHEQVGAKHLTNFQRYVFDALPRSSTLKPLVAEFGRYITLAVNPQNPGFLESILKKLPKGSKIVSRQLLPWENFRVEMADKIELESWPDKGADGPENDQKAVVELCRYGIPSEPHEFVQRALKAGHPKDLMGQVSQLLQETISSNFHRPPHLLAKERVDFVKKYSALAMELKAEELKLRYQMPDHIKRLMQGKRLALWGKC